VDRDHGVAGIVLAVEERVLLQPCELGAQRPEAGGDLLGHVAVHRGQLLGVAVLLGQPPVAFEALRHARVLGGRGRGPLLVVPEAHGAHLLLELGRSDR
jgi:hypothetical protein